MKEPQKTREFDGKTDGNWKRQTAIQDDGTQRRKMAHPGEKRKESHRGSGERVPKRLVLACYTIMNAGALWYFHGDAPQRPVTEADVIDFLQGNVVVLAEARLCRRGPTAIKHRFSARLDCCPIPSTSCPCRKNVSLEFLEKRGHRADHAGLSDRTRLE